MEALIVVHSPVHFETSLNGLPLGTHPSKDAAWNAIVAAMKDWYDLIPANPEPERTPA